MTLIQTQEKAITMMDEQRSSEKRYQRYLRRVVRPWFNAQLTAMGFDAVGIAQAWRDTTDIYNLRVNAEE